MDFAGIQEKLRANFAGRVLLWVLSLFYRAGVAARKAAYDAGFMKSFSVNARVVCFGNITTGGTGKTTAVMLAARELAAAGLRPAIITRGYKRAADKDVVVILSSRHSASWREAGDEAYMMFEALRDCDVPVVVCPDRVKAARAAVDEFKSPVLLMDDGFQHFRLNRDMDVALLDARDPFGGNSLLPLGRLREPKSALGRAGLILITHADLASPERLAAAKGLAGLCNSAAPLAEAVHEPEYYLDVRNARKVPLDSIKGEATALSAVGDPQSFEDTLRKLGLELTQKWRYPDHHPYTLAELADASRLCGGRPLITTYKDFTRFPENWRDALDGGVYILSIHMRIRGRDGIENWRKAIHPALAAAQPEKPCKPYRKPARKAG
ncbi:MAG: tetraacyldisaccharide 4'-kinase [Elusimicrobiales bacterium]